MEKCLRILVASLEYPPSSIGGYGIMCAQVCEWLHQKGHNLLVLTTIPLEIHTAQKQAMQEGPVPVRRILQSYWLIVYVFHQEMQKPYLLLFRS